VQTLSSADMALLNSHRMYDLISQTDMMNDGARVVLEPYQIMWLLPTDVS